MSIVVGYYYDCIYESMRYELYATLRDIKWLRACGNVLWLTAKFSLIFERVY